MVVENDEVSAAFHVQVGRRRLAEPLDKAAERGVYFPHKQGRLGKGAAVREDGGVLILLLQQRKHI